MQYTFEDQYKIKAKAECEIMDIYVIAQKERERSTECGEGQSLGGLPLLVPFTYILG